jgi:hypothetical protein
MNEIVSRRHPFKFYLAISLGSFFMFGLVFLAIISFWFEKENGTLESKHFIIPVAVILIGTLTIRSMKMYFRNSPRICISDQFISFNSTVYLVSEIEKVIFIGKNKFPFIVDYFMESATLYFKDGTKMFIFDDMYANTTQLKIRLSEIITGGKPIPRKDIAPDITGGDRAFKGNLLLTIRGLSFIVYTLFMIFCFAKWDAPVALRVFSGLLFMSLAAANVWVANFFVLTDQYLIVRHHLFFWKKKFYQLNEVRELVYERKGKMPNSLRVITIGYSSKLYPAATLSEETWLSMQKAFRARRIKVRNESI